MNRAPSIAAPLAAGTCAPECGLCRDGAPNRGALGWLDSWLSKSCHALSHRAPAHTPWPVRFRSLERGKARELGQILHYARRFPSEGRLRTARGDHSSESVYENRTFNGNGFMAGDDQPFSWAHSFGWAPKDLKSSFLTRHKSLVFFIVPGVLYCRSLIAIQMPRKRGESRAAKRENRPEDIYM